MARNKSDLVPWPESLILSSALRSYAVEHGLKADEEWEAFKDWHEARGSKFVSWPAAWRTWCRNAVKFSNSWHLTHKPIGFQPSRPIVMRQEQPPEEVPTPEQVTMNVAKLREMIASIGRKI